MEIMQYRNLLSFDYVVICKYLLPEASYKYFIVVLNTTSAAK